MGDRNDLDDVMETTLTIDYDKQWLNCVSPKMLLSGVVSPGSVCSSDHFLKHIWTPNSLDRRIPFMSDDLKSKHPIEMFPFHSLLTRN